MARVTGAANGDRVMLWGYSARRFANSYEFKGPGWVALLYDIAEPMWSGEWVWQLSFTRYQLASVGETYTTARGARNALLRAVKRLGFRIPKQKARARG